MRLFCLPHAGGGVTAFRSWNTGLPADIEICSVLLPGRETRSSERPFTQIDLLVDAIAAELKPWLDLPYAVFGHSMGALLAFELVQKLAGAGLPLPVHLFLSGRRAPQEESDPHLLHALPDEQFLDELNRIYRGIPKELLENPELMEVFLPVLRADIAVVESYKFRSDFRSGAPLDCPITVFAGMSDTSVTWEQLTAWSKFTRRRFALRMFPGEHFYAHGPLLEAIRSTLSPPNA